jgi:UDP-arabinose 4-epimerase
MQTVLVTGGAGYIGSHAAKALAKAGFQPVVLDNLTNGHLWAVKWGPFVRGDLADRALLIEVMRKYQVQAVMHFAASAYVNESMTDPIGYFRNNVENSLNLLEAQVEVGVKHIIFSSTCATYGVPQTLLIGEDNVQNPVNPYGESKRFVERMLYWFGQAYGLGWVALRYFNAAGADADGEIGELHEPETHLIPLVIQSALGLRSKVTVFGTDYPTPDGTAVRDYIHVDDLAAAHVLALKHLLGGGTNLALNLGTGKGHSVREVIETVERISGRPVQISEAGRRVGDPPQLVADAGKALSELNWKTRFSSLESIVRTSWRWQSECLQNATFRSNATHP